jgi:hypothetical protein
MSKIHMKLLTLLALVFLINACAPAEPEYSAAELQLTINAAVSLTSAAQTAAAPAATALPPTATLPAPTDAPTNTASPLPTSSVAVVFTPGGLFDAAKRAEFYARIINPYIAYYANLAATEGYPALVSINIQTFDLADYPYGADAIFSNEGYEGWLIAETGGVVNYWIPECINGPCPLSADFVTNFPDIAATVGAP